ncbi:tape measure protein [Pseudomonas aeruginosa]|uniref:tape measure protein n=1 Tax=Pseudomonas aeruginosa TaxID=287 RepID=UPI003AACEC31
MRRSAIDAYSKSIQTGKVSSDAWQSIMAAMPSLVNALAESTGKSTEEIRKLGIEGSLSLRDLNEGLRKTVAANREAADNMGTSVQDALVSLNNALSAYLGELNRTYDITGSVSSALNVLAENMEVIVKLFGVAAVAGLTRYVASLRWPPRRNWRQCWPLGRKPLKNCGQPRLRSLRRQRQRPMPRHRRA